MNLYDLLLIFNVLSVTDLGPFRVLRHYFALASLFLELIVLCNKKCMSLSNHIDSTCLEELYTLFFIRNSFVRIVEAQISKD